MKFKEVISKLIFFLDLSELGFSLSYLKILKTWKTVHIKEKMSLSKNNFIKLILKLDSKNLFKIRISEDKNGMCSITKYENIQKI